MAGDDDVDRIPVVRHPDGAEGAEMPDRLGNVAVGARLTIGDIEQGAPALELKLRSPQIQRK